MANLQSAWYLFPGQTENTPFQDRGKALITTTEGWGELTKHLERSEKQEQALQEEQERKRYLKEESYNMTKNWDNSIEKVRARRIEEHETRVRNVKEERMARFMELRAEQEKDRQEYIKKVKKQMFMMQEKSRNLNSALWQSEVMYERNLQNEFNEHQRQHDKIEEAKYAQKILREAEEERFENMEKRRNRRQANSKYNKALLAQIKDKEEQDRKAKEKSMRSEIRDNQLAVEEYEALKKDIIRKDKEMKKENMQIMLDFQQERERIKEEERQEDIAEDKIIEVYSRAKCKIDQKRKEKLQELQNDKIKLTENAAKLVMASTQGNDEREQQILENARLEFEARDNLRDKNEAEKKKKLRDARIQIRKDELQEEREREKVKKEIDKFLFLTRLKNAECYEEHQKEKESKEKQKMLQYGKELKEQMADLDNFNNKEMKNKEEEFKWNQKKLHDLDKKFFAYGDEVLTLAKDRGRPTLPIEQVIEKYKIENGLKPKKKNISQLKSNVPIDDKKTEKNCRCK